MRSLFIAWNKEIKDLIDSLSTESAKRNLRNIS